MLKEFSQFVDEVANVRPNPRLPWVGAAAFSHKGGTHVNAVQKLVRSYEHIDPALVGNSRQVLISELAGRSNIIMKARELGFDVSQGHARAERDADARQGARARGLRVRSGRRIARAADPARAQRRADAVSRSTPTTCRCARRAKARCAKRPSRFVSAANTRTPWPTATVR